MIKSLDILARTITTLTLGAMLAGIAGAQQPSLHPAPTQGAQQSTAPSTPQQPGAVIGGTGRPAPPPAPPPAPRDIPELPTQKDKASYALGLNWGRNLHSQSVDVDPDVVLRGLKDGMAGGKALLTDEETAAMMRELQAEVRKKQEEQRQQLGAANKEAGEKFLAANKIKEGVVTLPSGLQYKVLTEGTGAKPAATDTVVCNYRGTLLDGTEFDSSYKRGQPASFPVRGVIKGWTEALQLMPVGSKWQLVIPSDLAYGERGPGNGIGPNATLIFEVELVSIQSAEAQPKK